MEKGGAPMDTHHCLACQVNEGRTAPPGGVIYRDRWWQVDHRVDPGPILGWLVLKPLRHVEFLDALTDDEAATLGRVTRRVVGAMRAALPSPPAKVYALLLAEAADCPHLHWHLVPRSATHPREFRGPRIFSTEGPDVPRADIDALADRLRALLHAD